MTPERRNTLAVLTECAEKLSELDIEKDLGNLGFFQQMNFDAVRSLLDIVRDAFSRSEFVH